MGDHIDKVLEVLAGSRETIEIYKDTDFMLSTEKTNEILSGPYNSVYLIYPSYSNNGGFME